MKKNVIGLLTTAAIALLCWHGGALASITAANNAEIAGNAVTTVAFDGVNRLYVGDSANANNVNQCISAVSLSRNAGKTVVGLTALAPNAASLNGANAAANNQVKNMNIYKIATTPSGYPVLSTSADLGKVEMLTNINDGSTLLQNTTAVIESNSGAVDKTFAALVASDNYIIAAVPGNGQSDGQIDHATAGLALIKIDKAGNKLIALNASDGTVAAGPALKINTAIAAGAASTGPLALTTQATGYIATGAQTHNKKTVDMHWDQKLGKFYVGVAGLHAGNGDNGDRIVTLMVGAPDATTSVLNLTSAIGDAATACIKEQVADNSAGIFCNTKNAFATTNIVRTMHTSTGKSYAIVNGGAELAANSLQGARLAVYALPLVDAPGAAASDIGYIASIKDFSKKPAGANTNEMVVVKPATAFDGTTNADAVSASAVVGQAVARLAHTTTGNYTTLKTQNYVGIQDLQVVGDTVFAALNGANGNVGDNVNGEEKGIFASTALFDESGAIRAWTPWQRALPSREGVKNFGYDANSGNFWYLKANGESAVVTQWSKGDAGTALGGGNIHGGPDKMLAKVLGDNFTNPGVTRLFNFDAETPGFKTSGANAKPFPANEYEQFSMMVATGNGAVALINTGKTDGTATHPFIPTAEYKNTVTDNAKLANAATMANGDPIAIFDSRTKAGVPLANIGPIATAELARIAEAQKGWLIVGGKGGCAALSKANGDGFDSKAAHEGLAAFAHDAYPGGADWRFEQLLKGVDNNPFVDTRKLVSDGVYLYILTKTTLLRIGLVADRFKNVNGIKDLAANIITLADMTQATTTLGRPTAINGAVDSAIFDATVDEFYDMVLVDGTANAGKLLLATSKGLFVSLNTTAVTGVNTADPLVATTRWKKPFDKTGADNAFTCGQVLKLDFISSQRGGKMSAGDMASPASGNLHVTAVDAAGQNVCVYRFNVSNGTVKAFKEMYAEGNAVAAPGDGNSTDYFYKIGSVADIIGDVSLSDAFDMQPQSAEYGNHGVAGDFLGGVGITPNPSYFLNAGKKASAINLNADLSNGFQLANVVKDTASGALYIPGQFGVRVNE